AADAVCQPCRLVRPPLPRLAYCGLRPRTMQGEVSPCEPLWPAFQLILAEKIRLSQQIVRRVVRHDPCPVHPGMATGFFHRRAGPNGPGKTAANLICYSGLQPE